MHDCVGGLVLSALFVAHVVAQAPAATPPRDGQAGPQSGTAAIKGRITAADTGRPLRRARIVLGPTQSGLQRREASTDTDGRYEIANVVPGRYTITVTRSGYLQLLFGQRQPLEPGKPLILTSGQVADRIDFALPRMSVITGRITDETGEPVEGAGVFAMRMEYWNGKRQLVPANPFQRSDDAGIYRLIGLLPGTYVVMATMHETWSTTENGQSVQIGYAPTYLPGVPTVAEAQRITIGLAQQLNVSDFALVPGRAARISGIALDSSGQPLMGGNVGLSQEITGGAGGFFQSIGSGGAVRADGSFTLTNIPPGEYKIRATIQGNRQPGSVPEGVTQSVVMNGEDVDGLRLVSSAGWSVSGRIRAVSGDAPKLPSSRFSILASPTAPELNLRSSAFDMNAKIHDDWTFTIINIFGAARLELTTPTGWMLKEIRQSDRDITDEPIEMKSGERLSDVEVVVTNRPTRLSGAVTDEKGAPTSDATVLVFATQPEKWFDRSRWVRAVRPDQEGRYDVAGLPPGEYLAVAFDYVQDGVWNDPEHLATLARYGQKIMIQPEGSLDVPLRVVTPQP
jgi:hypothetical protein